MCHNQLVFGTKFLVNLLAFSTLRIKFRSIKKKFNQQKLSGKSGEKKKKGQDMLQISKQQVSTVHWLIMLSCWRPGCLFPAQISENVKGLTRNGQSDLSVAVLFLNKILEKQMNNVGDRCPALPSKFLSIFS